MREKPKDRAPLKSLNLEEVYQLMAQGKWSDLITLLHQHHKEILADSSLENAFKVFESEFTRNFDELRKDENFEKNLRSLSLLHLGRMYKLSDGTISKVTIELAKLSYEKGNFEEAYDYAKRFPNDEICANIIEKHEKALPKVVKHSQSQSIRVTENQDVVAADHTISLFKSNQEYDFFMAVREVFPMYIVYPNVALSTLMDFEKIKSSLSSEESEYFFKAVVDCVVFDQHRNYVPIYFFELDSSLHDSQKQITKDKYKDKVLAVSGKKLYRIRKLATSPGKNEFMKLVREVILK